MSLRLINVKCKCYKLKQNNYDDKIRRINFYFNEISKIKMNQHERFCKCFNKSLKRLSRDVIKNEQFTLLFLFIFFKQFRQRSSDFNIKSHETFIKIYKF